MDVELEKQDLLEILELSFYAMIMVAMILSFFQVHHKSDAN